MPGTARLEAYFQALTSGNRQVFRDLCASVMFRTSEVADGASAVAHVLDTSTAYVTAGAKLLSLRNATVEKFSVGYDGLVNAPGGIAFTNGGVPSSNRIYSANNDPSLLLVGYYGVDISSLYGDVLIRNKVAISQTWNSGLTTFKALTIDITDTASASGSLLADLRVGSVTKFKVQKDGSTFIPTEAVFGNSTDGRNYYTPNVNGYGRVSGFNGLEIYSGASPVLVATFRNDGSGGILNLTSGIKLGSNADLIGASSDYGPFTFGSGVSFQWTNHLGASPRMTLTTGGVLTLFSAGVTTPADCLVFANSSTPSTFLAKIQVSKSGAIEADNAMAFLVPHADGLSYEAMRLTGPGVLSMYQTKMIVGYQDSLLLGFNWSFNGQNYDTLTLGTGGAVFKQVAGVNTLTITPGYNNADTLITSSGKIKFVFGSGADVVFDEYNAEISIRNGTGLIAHSGAELHLNAIGTLGLYTNGGVVQVAMEWNNALTTYTAFKVNASDVASAAGSLLMDLQVAGTSKFAVRKDGRLSIADSLIMTGSAATSYVSSTYAGGAGTISMRITFPDQGSVFDDGIMIGSADQLLISSRAITFGTLVQAWRRNNGTTVAPIAIFSGDSACAFLGGLDASASLLLYGSAGYNPYSVGLVASSGGRLFFWFHQSIANNDFEIGLRGTGFSGWSDRVTAGYGENYILSFESDIRDAANAVSFGFRSKTTLSTAGACLLAAYNNTTLKFSVDKDGNVAAAGTLKFGTHSALAAETVTGYVTITDAAGNSRKLAVVS